MSDKPDNPHAVYAVSVGAGEVYLCTAHTIDMMQAAAMNGDDPDLRILEDDRPCGACLKADAMLAEREKNGYQ